MLACTRWISPQNFTYSWSCDPCTRPRNRWSGMNRLKIDRLDSAENWSTPSTRFPLFTGLFIFRCTTSVEQHVFHRLFVCHNHVLCSWLLDNSQTCRLARLLDPCAKTTGGIELQFVVLTGLGQCHFVLDGCPIPSPPSVTFPGEGHSWSLNILLPYISQTAQVDAWSKQNTT